MILISEDQYKLGKFNPCLIKGFFYINGQPRKKEYYKSVYEERRLFKKK